MNVLFLDGYNLIYRARYSFKHGEHPTIYSFFRSFRVLVEKFNPDLVYFVTEGYPQDRYDLLPEYKGTRVREDDDSFKEQKREIISLLKSSFPVMVCRHSRYECDDVLANLVMWRHGGDECTVVSTDTDFLQLYNTCSNVMIYNPVKKEILEAPDLDYVKWKALRGDPSDNIKGIRGIGDKRAAALLSDPPKLVKFFEEDIARRDIFERNCKLIQFANIQDQLDILETDPPCINWEKIKEKFEKWGFNSITNQKSWLKFQHTFTKLEKSIYIR